MLSGKWKRETSNTPSRTVSASSHPLLIIELLILLLHWHPLLLLPHHAWCLKASTSASTALPLHSSSGHWRADPKLLIIAHGVAADAARWIRAACLSKALAARNLRVQVLLLLLLLIILIIQLLLQLKSPALILLHVIKYPLVHLIIGHGILLIAHHYHILVWSDHLHLLLTLSALLLFPLPPLLHLLLLRQLLLLTLHRQPVYAVALGLAAAAEDGEGVEPGVDAEDLLPIFIWPNIINTLERLALLVQILNGCLVLAR